MYSQGQGAFSRSGCSRSRFSLKVRVYFQVKGVFSMSGCIFMVRVYFQGQGQISRLRFNLEVRVLSSRSWVIFKVKVSAHVQG